MIAKIVDYILDTIDDIKYGLLGLPLPELKAVPPDVIQLKIFKSKEGSIYGFAPKHPGFIVSADNHEELIDAIQDTLMVYFDVPRYIARHSSHDGTLTLPNGTEITVKTKEGTPNELKKFKFA